MSAGCAVVVDPYSSGVLLCQEFQRRGVEYLIVRSGPIVPKIYRSSLRGDESAPVIFHTGNLEETLTELRQFSVQCVLPGCDLGVGLAQELGQALGLPGDDPKLNKERTNKFLMTELVRKRGLPVPAQLKSCSRAEILEWCRLRNTFPVVLKPLNSTSSEGVFIATSENEIGAAVSALIGQTNALGHVNDAVLVQEFVSGTEYVVDTVSYAGAHQPAAFWRYHKSDLTASLPGPECIELLPLEGKTQQALFAYAIQVLDALGIRYGAAHIELIWSQKGPMLIELGARVNGGKNPLICLTCTGDSQIQQLVDAYLSGAQWTDRTAHRSRRKHGMRVFLIPRRKGEYRNRAALDEIRKLDSFHELYAGSRQSWEAPRRIGWVILVHDDADVIEQDLAQIRKLEETELYA